MTSDRAHTALMAIAISVAPDQQGRQLSSRMIEPFTDNARAAGLSQASSRRCARRGRSATRSIPIEEYMLWRRDDGTHFDPWLRIHELVGRRDPRRRRPDRW